MAANMATVAELEHAVNMLFLAICSIVILSLMLMAFMLTLGKRVANANWTGAAEYSDGVVYCDGKRFLVIDQSEYAFQNGDPDVDLWNESDSDSKEPE